MTNTKFHNKWTWEISWFWQWLWQTGDWWRPTQSHSTNPHHSPEVPPPLFTLPLKKRKLVDTLVSQGGIPIISGVPPLPPTNPPLKVEIPTPPSTPTCQPNTMAELLKSPPLSVIGQVYSINQQHPMAALPPPPTPSPIQDQQGNCPPIPLPVPHPSTPNLPNIVTTSVAIATAQQVINPIQSMGFKTPMPPPPTLCGPPQNYLPTFQQRPSGPYLPNGSYGGNMFDPHRGSLASRWMNARHNPVFNNISPERFEYLYSKSMKRTYGITSCNRVTMPK